VASYKKQSNIPLAYSETSTKYERTQQDAQGLLGIATNNTKMFGSHE